MALTQREIDAFNQVKTTIDTLQTEYAAVCVGITATEKQLSELPLLPVPVSDLKAAILDFVDASGGGYLSEQVKPAIIDFATSRMGGSSVKNEEVGRPLSYKALLSAAIPSSGALSRAQLLTYSEKHQFNDLVLYAFFGALVKTGLSAVMDTMSDAEFGYARLTPDQIGTDRATRSAAIQAAQEQLTTLHAKKAALADSLRQLGVSVKG